MQRQKREDKDPRKVFTAIRKVDIKVLARKIKMNHFTIRKQG